MQSRAARSPASFRSMQRGHVCNFTCHIFIYSMSSCGHDAPQGEPEEQLRALRTLANMSKRSASAVPVKTVQDGFRNFGAAYQADAGNDAGSTGVFSFPFRCWVQGYARRQAVSTDLLQARQTAEHAD
jgi:hypothetical protein